MLEAIGDTRSEGVADQPVELGRSRVVEVAFRIRVILALVDDPPPGQPRVELAEGALQLRDSLVNEVVIQVVRVRPLVGIRRQQGAILAQQQFRRHEVEPRQDLLLRVLGLALFVHDL